ncbi:MAG: tRNA preQ1(34) S-adenosylmethionine ribosyltransferase-isomerase QueA [Candidatus Peribacteraceae bacterium]|nr:tRNA preQ1(34) S-adenosylmethionine ribosyltransferase-isomerase QueA [Candidatus Peribacteraceae bacterium]
MPSFDDILRLYDYAVPAELVAQAPAAPRDAARLLVHDRRTGTTTDASFREIGNHLPPGAVLVINETKVIPARLRLWRDTGGQAEVLLLGTAGGLLKAFASRRLRPEERLCHGTEPLFEVAGENGKEWFLRPLFPLHELPAVLERFGEAPLPPYIRESPLSRTDLLREYQSVFAREPGSIAAPTASLHFTERLLEKLKRAGIGIVPVTLHVHLGTFAPLSEDRWKKGALHREEYRIHPHAVAALEAAKTQGRPVIAVGTTVVRTLESAADAAGKIVRPSGTTNLFIREGHPFRVVDGLLTNFHVPRSSLLMLVAAFMGRGTMMDLYGHAVKERYRFFSFGDAMLIL